MKFKVGDRIRVITERWNRADFTQTGKIGTIISIYKVNSWLTAALDYPQDSASNGYSYLDTEIEHLPPPPPSDTEYHDIFSGQEIYDELEGKDEIQGRRPR